MRLNSERLVRDVIVLGGSAGGVQAMITLLDCLRAAPPAYLVLVLHRGPGPSFLPNVLARHAPFPVRAAQALDVMDRGCLYVAQRGTHLVFSGAGLATLDTDRVHSVRPAIDPLFFSAAELYGPRVVAVLLSGSGRDGVAGLNAIHARGGLVLVQDPADAAFRYMPLAAVGHDHPDAVLHTPDIAAAISALALGLSYSFDAPDDGDGDGDPAAPLS